MSRIPTLTQTITTRNTRRIDSPQFETVLVSDVRDASNETLGLDTEIIELDGNLAVPPDPPAADGENKWGLSTTISLLVILALTSFALAIGFSLPQILDSTKTKQSRYYPIVRNNSNQSEADDLMNGYHQKIELEPAPIISKKVVSGSEISNLNAEENWDEDSLAEVETASQTVSKELATIPLMKFEAKNVRASTENQNPSFVAVPSPSLIVKSPSLAPEVTIAVSPNFSQINVEGRQSAIAIVQPPISPPIRIKSRTLPKETQFDLTKTGFEITRTVISKLGDGVSAVDKFGSRLVSSPQNKSAIVTAKSSKGKGADASPIAASWCVAGRDGKPKGKPAMTLDEERFRNVAVMPCTQSGKSLNPNQIPEFLLPTNNLSEAEYFAK